MHANPYISLLVWSCLTWHIAHYGKHIESLACTFHDDYEILSLTTVAEAERAKDQLTSLADISAPGAPGAPSSGLGGLGGLGDKREWSSWPACVS